MRLITRLMLVAAVLVSAQASATPEFSPCSLTGSGGNGNLHAECARWARPVDPDNPGGEQIELFVARLPSTALDPAPDALTLINGGPGGSSVDMLVDFAGIAEAFTRERDVVVLDQRGTGRSAPLNCSSLTDAVEIPGGEATLNATRRCLEGLPHDPRFFSTTVAVQDLEALRAALGYDQFSLYGVSYGTRVVMQYMRMFPEQARVAVIDGVVPPTQALGSQIAVHSHNTLRAVLERCAETDYCHAQYPQLAADFDTLAARLQQTTVPMTLNHPVTGAETDIDLSYGHLAAWLRFSLYVPETTALIPLIIHQAAARQNYLPVAANALRLVDNLASALSYGMHNAVVCTEDSPFFDDATMDFDALSASYLGREMYDTLKAMCSVWPAGVLHPDMKAPLESSVPTLVLSGEFDPITPPAWGEAVLPGLKRARHLVAPGQGHGTLARGCMPVIVRDFVESTDLDAIDDQCLQHLGPYPFFIDPMGPPP